MINPPSSAPGPPLHSDGWVPMPNPPRLIWSPCLAINLQMFDETRLWPVGQVKGEPAVVLPALTNCMNDADAEVRQSAVTAILNYREAAKSLVPVLLKAINDQDPRVRESARFALMWIDRDAAASAGVK